MDDLERMYRHLVHTIREGFGPLLTQPFEVGALYQTILPYRVHRRELGLETNQDYELTMLELLSGARGYLIVDDRMRDALLAEHASPAPDPAKVREFAAAHVALAPEPLQRLEIEGRASGSRPSIPRADAPAGSVATAAATRPSVATPSAGVASEGMAVRRTTRAITIAAPGECCGFCKGALPAGRPLSFCPHCGQDLTVVHCPACGSEVERGWKFCVTCGRSALER